MPTYEFRCPNGHDFEKFYRSISGAPTELACPVCGKLAVRQLSGGAGLHFKGSGFYITDYGKDGKKSQTPPTGSSDKPTGSDSSAPKSDASSSAKSDAKPADAKPDSGTKSKGSKAAE